MTTLPAPLGACPPARGGISRWQPVVSEADRFLRLIGKDPTTTWLRSIKPGGGGAREQKGVDTSWITSQSDAGFNLYAVIAEAASASGRGGGVTDADITHCQALFVEWDDSASIEEQAKRWQGLGLPEPSVMVATGGKSVHAYWVTADAIAPEHWKRITRRLIAHCDSDPSCSNPSRVMRLPGSVYFDKRTGEPTGRCRIIATCEGRYSAADIEACLPSEDERKPVAEPRHNTHEARGVDEVEAAAQYIPRRTGGQGTYGMDRNALCGCSAALKEAGVADPDGAALALLGHKWPSKAAAQQVLDSTSTRNAASFWAIARDNGYDLRRSGQAANQTQPLSTSAGDGRKTSNQAAPDKPEPLTFEQRWERLELHAAEMVCTTWPVMKTVASMAEKASELQIPRLGQRQLEQLLDQAQRKVRAKSEPVMGGGTFTIQPTPWAVDGLFRHGLNLLVGQSGAGKSRLAAACMAAWLRGDETWLQRRLHGLAPQQRHALIIGTDQSLTDWHLTLGPVGLTTKVSDTEVRVHERVTLYGLESGVQLDADGLNTIRRWVDEHPGGMVIVDSLAQCLPPGVDEDKSSAGRPIHQLQEALGDAWALLTHHTRKGAGREGNIGVGAGRGSGAIDAAVSRVIGLGLIHKMENGQMVAQESDPRRELLSTKRGGKTEHLVVSSDEHGFCSCTAEPTPSRSNKGNSERSAA